MSRALKQDAVLELSKLYEAEFNQPELHDRVLIFDVVASDASWPHNVSDADENETREDCSQNEDGNGAETTEIANEETNINSREAASLDCETTTTDAYGWYLLIYAGIQ
jgi:hypothetical protein